MRLGELISKAKIERCGDRLFPVLSMTMHDGIIKQSERFKKSIASKDVSTYKVVCPGQLVVGFPINEGVIYIQGFDEPGIMSPAYNVWDIDTSVVAPSYLELALHGPACMAYYADKMRGTTARRRTLTSESLTAMSIPLPSLDQQKRIVGNLCAVRSQLAICHRQLSLLDDLVKSRFVEMFGDGGAFAPCLMSDLVSNIVSGSNVGGVQRPLLDGEYAVLKISAVTKGTFNPMEYKVVDGKQLPSHLVHPRKGDLLFSRANTSEMVGATAIVDADYDHLFLPDKLWRLDAASDVDPVFLKHLLSSPALRSAMSKVSTGTSGSMQNISMAKFRKLRSFKPPLDLQREFAAFAACVDKSQVAAQRFLRVSLMVCEPLS